nr:asparagine synthase (glutamine-hydrolyzing) [uncultured Desulfobacter sp.]
MGRSCNMCGIVGIAGDHSPGWIDRMNMLIAHRGPDDAGVYHSPDNKVTMAMRRLSILDLAYGHQPMSDKDDSIWIVFNGEIFNSPALRRTLEKQGYHFKTRNSDTEVLLKLYQRDGQEMVKALNGMFAFVIYDQQTGILFGARDRFGIKPLYYHVTPQRFAFASELKSLKAMPFFNSKLNPQAVFHYMSLLYVPGPESIFSGVRRLPAGHWFSYNLREDELKICRFWRPGFDSCCGRTVQEWAVSIRQTFQDAVKRWSLSDVPVACSLSGGIDSAAITAMMSRFSDGPVRTFTLGFSDQMSAPWDETDRANLIAEKYHTDHHVFRLSAEELLTDLVKMVWHMDEPYAGGLPAWYIFKEMAKTVRVGITGTGGDELFGQYGQFIRYESDPHTLSAITNRANSLKPLESCVDPPFGASYYALSAYMSDALKKKTVFTPSFCRNLLLTSNFMQDAYDEFSEPILRNGLTAVNFRYQLAEEFLAMTDRFSMAHSVEARTPFLDNEFVDLVLTIPPEIRTDPQDRKYLEKLAFAPLLPSALMSAPNRGFVLPIEIWLRTILRKPVQTLLSRRRLALQGIFSPDVYDAFITPHLEGRENHTWRIWALFMFQLWHVVYIEKSAVECPEFDFSQLVLQADSFGVL